MNARTAAIVENGRWPFRSEHWCNEERKQIVEVMLQKELELGHCDNCFLDGTRWWLTSLALVLLQCLQTDIVLWVAVENESWRE